MLSLAVYFICQAAAIAQVLELNEGKVQGFEYETEKDDIAEVFLNIPFASPPIGELRFERPQPPKPWLGVRDGTTFGAACVPIVPEATFTDSIKISEDCLSLNIIRPSPEVSSGHLLPILFYVHGSGFGMFSAVQCGYKGFAEMFAGREVIVVTIQYRLGVYGFFSTGNEEIPGNMGLFDMAEALKFVHSNAKRIGGDPSRITVWGESAGGAAAGHLILSPITRDHIVRSIEMSGSPWTSFAIGSSVVKNSLELANALECKEKIKSCMKQKTREEIVDAIRKVGSKTGGYDFVKWGPVIDGIFLLNPDEMAATAPPKKSIIGVTAKEAIGLALLGPPLEFFHSLYIDPSTYSTWDRQKLVKKLMEFVMKTYVGNHLSNILQEVIGFYVDKNEEKHFEFYLERYIEFLSDLLFNVPAVDGILARRSAGWDIYAYVFDYCPYEFNDKIPERLRGATHGSEFVYFGDISAVLGREFEEEEENIADFLGESLSEFAKNGHPSNNQQPWLRIKAGSAIRFMNIAPKCEMKTGFFNESASFWQKTRKYGFDMVKLLRTRDDMERVKDEL
ncbi:unnamed protein product [Cylicocyclus nassatus]|uniref:Carboxylesterase type B domain-containing protein n=1 Tax=Cylicocyclus nassatus TaxID=53992 RepID=A0AA36DL78_CYLNA|nr:unnamed protein product [Cylicocyclus nassatus]